MKKILGLRDALRKPKGQHVWYWIPDLMWQVRYAWQRAWRGYDDTDVFELDFSFAAKMPVLFREFKEKIFPCFTITKIISPSPKKKLMPFWMS